MLRALAAALAALVLAPAAQAAPISPPPPEHRADPSLTTYVERLGPYTIGSYETLQKTAKAHRPPSQARSSPWTRGWWTPAAP